MGSLMAKQAKWPSFAPPNKYYDSVFRESHRLWWGLTLFFSVWQLSQAQVVLELITSQTKGQVTGRRKTPGSYSSAHTESVRVPIAHFLIFDHFV